MYKYQLITVTELKKYFENDKDFILLDVRENFELEIASISHSIHIPMKDIPNRVNELDKNKEIIIICKSGVRSAKVCEFLQKCIWLYKCLVN